MAHDRLSMDEIAVRAQVGKGAVYRTVALEGELVVDAIVMWRLARSPALFRTRGRSAATSTPPSRPCRTWTRQMARCSQCSWIADCCQPRFRTHRRPGCESAGIGSEHHQRCSRTCRSTGRDRAGRDLSLVPDMMIGLKPAANRGWTADDREFFRRVIDDLVLPVLLGPDQTTTPSKRE